MISLELVEVLSKPDISQSKSKLFISWLRLNNPIKIIYDIFIGLVIFLIVLFLLLDMDLHEINQIITKINLTKIINL